MNNNTTHSKKSKSEKLLLELLTDLHNFSQKYRINKLEEEGRLPSSRQSVYKRAARKAKREGLA